MFHHGKLTPPGLLALAGLLLLLASGCGESNDPAVDGGQAGTDAKTVKDLAADMAKDRTADKGKPDAFVRKTCTSLGAQCGKAHDGCGGTLSCGACTPPKTCGGSCVPPPNGESLCLKGQCSASCNTGWTKEELDAYGGNGVSINDRLIDKSGDLWVLAGGWKSLRLYH